MKKIILLLVLVFLAVPVYGTDSYTDFYNISGNCSDGNPGTIGQPFCTISTGLANIVSPGDTLYIRNGTYNENITISASGTSGSRITIGGYQDETVILDGLGSEYGIYISGKNYITVEKLSFVNFNETGAFIESTKGIELKNLAFSGSIMNITNADSIIIENVISSGNQTHISNVNYSSLKNISFSNSAEIYFNNLTETAIENLDVHDSGGITLVNSSSINLTAMEMQNNAGNLSIISSNNVKIINSTVSNSSGIVISGCNNTKMERNRIYGNSNGLDINNTYNTQFLLNLIYDNSGNAVKISESYNITSGRNTISNEAISVYIITSNITMKSNIVSSPYYSLILDTASYFDSDYNVFYGTINYNNDDYNFGDYVSQSGHDNHSYGVNPLFTDDLHLSSGSNAIDAGLYLNITDFDGLEAYDDSVSDKGFGEINYSDIGAYEFTRPRIFLIYPNDSQMFIDENITFSFNATDFDDIENCTLIVNGAVIETNYTIVKGEETNFTMNDPTGGKINWTIRCYNKAGMYSEENRTVKVIRIDDFDGNTTALADANLSNLTLVIEKIPYGKINFTSLIDLSDGADINRNVNISYNRVEINLTELDNEAIITLYSINFTNPRIMKNGEECGAECIEIYFENETFVFSVTGIGIYTTEETPGEPEQPPPSPPGGASPSYRGCYHYLEIAIPENISIVLGDYWYLTGKIKNSGTCTLENVEIVLETPENWITESMKFEEIEINEVKEIRLKITPRKSNIGNYECTLKASSTSFSESKIFYVLITDSPVNETVDSVRQYIMSAEVRIQEAIDKGIDMSRAQRLLQKAIELYNKGYYNDAKITVVEALNMAEESIDNYQPEPVIAKISGYFYLFILIFSLIVGSYYGYKRFKKWKKYSKFRGLYVPFRTRGQ